MISFKKVSAILSSVVMIGASIGMAAAASYPTPFVSGGVADVAIVYGTGSGVSSLDLIQSGNIQANLQSYMSSSSSSGSTSVSGESVSLDTSGTRIYINDSLNTVKSVLTKSDLPTVLADYSFSGNVDATVTQTIKIGNESKISFAKQPSSDDDPNVALATNIGSTKYIYQTSAQFSKAVNLTSADSEGQEIALFGQKYTVSSASDTDTLVLMQSAEKVDLNSDVPSTTVSISGKEYTIELVSASDTSATIRVTDSSGTSDSREINEASSKKISGIQIAVTSADENNLRYSASIVAGSDKITLETGTSVMTGENSDAVDGTNIAFTSTSATDVVGTLTGIAINVSAPESDMDAIKAGESFTDPVFKTFKLDFAGLNIADDSTSRETITFSPDGSDAVSVKFSDHRGYEKTIDFARNMSGAANRIFMAHDSSGHNITVAEGQNIKSGEYVVVGNEQEGYLLKLTNVRGNSSTSTDSRATFTDVFSGESIETVFTGAGNGTLTIGGKQYSMTVSGNKDIAADSYNVTINYPDSTGQNVVLYPTIETNMGAKVMLYKPQVLNLTNKNSLGETVANNNISALMIPDGDGYTTLTVTPVDFSLVSSNWTIGSGYIDTMATDGTNSTLVGVGPLLFNISSIGKNNSVNVSLMQNVAGTVSKLTDPAVVIFEEKDDLSNYNAWVVTTRVASGSMGVNTVKDTWSNGSTASGTYNGLSVPSADNKKDMSLDRYGVIVTRDTSNTDQYSATLSYPNEQVYAKLYLSEESATITSTGATAGSSTQLGDVLVKDTEVSSVSSKNLIVIGGSCINSAAAKVLGLGSAACGAAFTDGTGVGTGEFLIKGVSGAYTTGKIALVVAGYEAADTVNAAKYLTTQTVDTSKEYKGTSATSATLVTTTA